MQSLIQLSGEVSEIRSGPWSFKASNFGASIQCLYYEDIEVINGFDQGDLIPGAAGQILCPYPNRIRDAKYKYLNKKYQLPVNEIEKNNAIHGLVRYLVWDLVNIKNNNIKYATRLAAQPGYPFILDLEVKYILSDVSFRCEFKVTNVCNFIAPFGLGFHPYFSLGAKALDGLFLELNASKKLITDDQMIPIGHTDLDHSVSLDLSNAVLDTCYTSLKRDKNGTAFIKLVRANENLSMTLALYLGYDYVMVYTGDTLPNKLKRKAVAIEPMTMAPNAFNTGHGLLLLEPGESREFVFEVEIGDL
jgi:aldose 1-epimerase